VRAFITVGQGISKLRLLQRMDWDSIVSRKAWRSRLFVITGLFLAGLPAVGVVVGKRIGVPRLATLATFPVYPVLMAAGFLSLVIGVRHAIRAVSIAGDGDEDLALPGLAWRDYYASADPVSNGPLTPTGKPGPDDSRELHPRKSGLPGCQVVYNRGSLLTDHNSYLRNQDQFLSWLLNDLVVAAYGHEYPATRQPRLVQDGSRTGDHDLDWVTRRRRVLVDWLVGGRVLTVGLGIALWFAAPGRLLDGPLNDLIRVSGASVGMHGLTVRSAVVSIIMIAVYVVGVVVPWRIMERRSARQFFAHATRLDRPSRLASSGGGTSRIVARAARWHAKRLAPE
jgi:hypothetical protein